MDLASVQSNIGVKWANTEVTTVSLKTYQNSLINSLFDLTTVHEILKIRIPSSSHMNFL
jgi:hypothetical protein